MSGTIWVSLGMTGSAAALVTYFTRADPLVALAKSLPRLDHGGAAALLRPAPLKKFRT
jgi:hypothetical protein